jgi:hypothetical protein
MGVSRQGYMQEGLHCIYTCEKEKRDTSGQTFALSGSAGDP